MKYIFLGYLLYSATFLRAQSAEPLGTDRPGEGTDAASVLGVECCST